MKFGKAEERLNGNGEIKFILLAGRVAMFDQMISLHSVAWN
jgi:hypothetical protein